MEERRGSSLAGKKLYIPRMTYAGAKCMAAAFRSVGIDADVTPPSDERTLELGARYTSGDECYPHKVTLGDFLKIIESPGFNPDRVAFFMPTADGPCRFGQYAPFLKTLLKRLGWGDAMVASPTSANGYDGVGEHAGELMRTGWRAIVAGDILRKLLLKTRPYEINKGESLEVFEESLAELCRVVEVQGIEHKERLGRMVEALTRARDEFRAIPANYSRSVPLIGVVGEIFCRLNSFSNDYLVRRIEEAGGEGWLSDVCEWVWYTNVDHIRELRMKRRTYSREMLGALLKKHFQRKDEEALLEPFQEDFRGYEEPHDVREVLNLARPYLDPSGALGEMVLSVGKAIYLYHKGADGIIDISPFTCMNGIVCEAVYPRVSREHGSIPIRNFYFDGTHSDMERDVGIFMELARSYGRRKPRARRYPSYFT